MRPPVPTHLLAADFSPPATLAGADAQTLAGTFLPRALPAAAATTHDVPVAPGASVRVLAHWQPDRAAAFTAVLLHGLEGSADSPFMHGLAFHGWRHGMNVVRMNMRTCGGTAHLAPGLYSSALWRDIERVAEFVVEKQGATRLGLVGYSMGGNMVLRLAGAWGSSPPAEVKACAAVCPAVDLGSSSDALARVRNRPYQWFFLAGLAMRARGIVGPLRDAQGRRRRWFDSVRDFDNAITAPHAGFPDADAYYGSASALHHLRAITLPTLHVHSDDDPFVPLTDEARAALKDHPHLHAVVPARGGHCGFVGVGRGPDRFWAEKRVMDFLAWNAGLASG